jgi:SAM-dependent methyltransferase
MPDLPSGIPGRNAPGPATAAAAAAPPVLHHDFYRTLTGGVAAHVLRARLLQLWPDLTGLSLLGIGYAAPYLRLWRGHAYRTVAAAPWPVRPAPWPAGQPSLTCRIEDDRLPFPDLAFDRVLLVHGVEQAGNARRLLREVWRVLRDDGRLIVVAPNRMGVWAHVETTPFGHGQPYSAAQVRALLAAAMFRPERQCAALFVPPLRRRFALRYFPLWEQAGACLAPGLGGVILTEAVKEAYAAMPLTPPARRRVILPETA